MADTPDENENVTTPDVVAMMRSHNGNESSINNKWMAMFQIQQENKSVPTASYIAVGNVNFIWQALFS